MTLQEKAAELLLYQHNASEEDWESDFCQELTEELLRYLQTAPHPTLHGLLDHLLAELEKRHIP